ncbi:MAG: ABC transporter substrate-binding protein [Chloroflexota bacterium]|nr:ABC transporter substrate-binding protein [Chloroflexota bacterium]
MSGSEARRSTRPLSRRGLLRRVAAVGLSVPAGVAVLSACASPAPPAAPPAPAPTAPIAPAVTPPGTAAGAAGPTPQVAGGGGQAGGTPKRGGTLRAVVVNDFTTMWPTLATGPTAAMCYDWLVRWRKGADGQWGPQPGLAESWDLADTSATFKLRRGIKFHDGSDLNADAVAWNAQQWMQNPKSLARDNLLGVDDKNPASVVDDYTLKINLTGPNGALLAALSDATATTGIASPAAFDKLGQDGLNLQAVGTGPFVFEQFQSGSQLVVNRNDKYWDKDADASPLPYLDKVVYRFVPNDSVRLTEMRSGNADITDTILGRDALTARGDSSLVYLEDPTLGNRYRFFFNGQKGPFKDNLKLRQAVSYAIDRDAIAKAVGASVGVPQKYDLTKGVIGYDESAPFYGFDLDKAKALFAESGAPSGLQIDLVVITREADQLQAQIIQQMLDNIGIKAQISALERVAWGDRVRKQNDFDMGTQRTGTAVDPDQLSLSWASTGPAAYIRATGPEIDTIHNQFDLGRGTYDLQWRQQIYKDLQTQWFNTAWWGFLWLQPQNYILSKRVKSTPAFLSAQSPVYLNFWHEELLWLDT